MGDESFILVEVYSLGVDPSAAIRDMLLSRPVYCECLVGGCHNGWNCQSLGMDLKTPLPRSFTSHRRTRRLNSCVEVVASPTKKAG